MISGPLTDHTLARRLEGAEGSGNAEFVEARSRVSPHVGAEWIEVAGAKAMFDGVGSPCTQVFGLGMFDDVEPAHLERLEGFYFSRGADCELEVCTLAPTPLHHTLADRGYRPVEMSQVMVRSLDAPILPSPSPVGVRTMETHEAEAWATLSAEGWSDVAPEYLDFIRALGRVHAERRDTVCYFADADGAPVATAALSTGGGVALLAGASTIPSHRRMGAQAALLSARLQQGIADGCNVAMVVTEPGSGSQRNAERNGFRAAYGRIKWRRSRP